MSDGQDEILPISLSLWSLQTNYTGERLISDVCINRKKKRKKSIQTEREKKNDKKTINS